jgi:hypothetical protein
MISGTCCYIGTHINADISGFQLLLPHDFYNIIFKSKINYWYSLRLSAYDPPPMKNCVGTCLHLFSVCSPWQVWYFNPFWLQFYNKLQFTIFIMSRKAVAHISLSRIANHFHSHVKIHIGQHHVSVKYMHCIHFSTKSDSPPPIFREAKRSLCYRSPFQQTGSFFDCLVSRTLMDSNLILH